MHQRMNIQDRHGWILVVFEIEELENSNLYLKPKEWYQEVNR